MTKKLITVLLTLIVILMAFIAFLITTQPGLTTTIAIARHIVPGKLDVAYAKGRIIGPLTLDDFIYHHNKTHVYFTSLKLNWHPSSLLLGRLNVSQFSVNHLSIRLPNSQKTTKKTSSFSLPVQFTLKNIELHDVRLQLGDSAPTLLQDIKLNAYSKNSQIVIESLKTRMAPYSLTAKGFLNLKAPFDTNLNLRLSNAVPHYTNVNIDLLLKGDENKYVFSANAEKPLQAAIQGSLIKPFDHGEINITGLWKNIVWPLNVKQVINLNKGHLKVTGTLKKYQFDIGAQVSGTQLPSSHWQFIGNGDWHNINLHQLTATLLNGSLGGQANIDWKNGLSWKTTLTGKHLNPAAEWPNWKGNINLALQSAGNLNDFTAKLNSQGVLNGNALNINTHINYTLGQLTIKNLTARVGNNHLQAHGLYGNKTDLYWNVKLPNLASISRSIQGDIASDGVFTVTNAQGKSIQEIPRIDGRLSASHLKVANLAIAQLKINAKFDPDSQQASHIDITGQKIKFKQLVLNHLTSTFVGTLKRHQLSSNISTPQGDFDLRVTGAYAQKQWHGTLQTFTLTSRKYHTWRLQHPIEMMLGKTIIIKPFCWSSNIGSICGEDNFYSTDHWHAYLNIKNFNAAIAEDFFPKNVKLSTDLNALINLTKKGEQVSGVANLQIKSAHITYQSKPKPFSIHLVNSSLKASLNNHGFTSTLILQDQKNLLPITASFNLPKYTGNGLPNLAQPINGKLSANWQSFGFLADFIPDIDAISGHLSANLNLDGTLIKPLASGRIQLSNGLLRLNKYGLTIKNIRLTANAKQSTFDLTGQLSSGGNTLNLNGSLPLNPLIANSETTLNLSGHNLLVINTKEYKAHISPDLHITYKQNKLKVTGSINIPKAKITPEDFTSTVQLPSNTTIIRGGESEKTGESLQTYINLKVTLGQHIYLQYSGLYATLGGGITVNIAPNQLTTASGSLYVTKGHYEAYGKRLNIKNGVLLFTGGPIDNPGLNILATKTINITQPGQALSNRSIIIGVQVSGTISEPIIKLYSIPSMGNADILSYLLFGQSSEHASQSQLGTLVQAAQYMGIGGKSLTSSIRSKLGLEEFGIQQEDVVNPATNVTEQNTAFVVGKRIGRNLLISYSIGILIPVNILKVRYSLGKHWAVQSDTSSYGSGADIFYTFERN